MQRLNVRELLGCVVLAVLLSSVGLVNRAAIAADDAKPAAKEKAKPKGRLPNYYSKVIDDQQRDKIYKIQDTYKSQIEELQAKLKEVTAKQNAEIDAVLTSEQREKLKTLAAEAKAKAATKKPADAPAKAEAKPTS